MKMLLRIACLLGFLLALGEVNAQVANIAGRVSNAVNGQSLAGATVSIGGVSTLTDAQGNYAITFVSSRTLTASFSGTPTNGSAPLTVTFTNLSTDTPQTLQASATGFITYTNSQLNIATGASVTNRFDISLSPTLGGIGAAAMRVVLNWGALPTDLDSHLSISNYGITGFFAPGHVYYANQGSLTTIPFAQLDVDDVTSFGPETITIQSFSAAGLYHYYVHNFSGTQNFQTSGATVSVYTDQGLIATFTPPATGSGVYWHVFAVDSANTNIASIGVIAANETLPPVSSWTSGGVGTGGGSTNVIRYSYLWDFGDGTTSTNLNPVKTYVSPGSYNVRLTVTTSDNRTNVVTKTAYVQVSIPLLSFSDAYTAEGNGAFKTLTLNVALTGSVNSAQARVDYATLAGTATGTVAPPGDYQTTNGTLIFPPGVTNGTISINIWGDAVAEPDETFRVVFFNATNLLMTATNLTVNILDDDSVPSNDGCATPKVIASTPYRDIQANAAAGSSGDPAVPCVTGFGKGLWHTYTATQDGTLTVDTIGSDFDTGLALYTGSCGSYSLLGCDDDSGGSGTSRLKYHLTSGVTYSILTGGKNGAAGTLYLNVSFQPDPPIITEILPTSGPVGSQVYILGHNFSSTLQSNIVFFGAVQATVVAADIDVLTVTVPAGASFGPVKVTQAGNTAESTQYFDVTFPSTGGLDANSFGPRTDFSVGTGSRVVLVVDLDGDGQPDVVTANYDTNSISVLRNVSVSHAINAGTFAAKQTYATQGGPIFVQAADLDGDGLPDLIVANYQSASVSVFKNTSTPGTISFASRIDFTTGDNPRAVAVADLDGDGKPEIIVANEASGRISVLQNLCTNGVTSTSSFGPKVDYVVGKNPAALAVADFDGDGKLDVAVANSFNGVGGNSVTLLRNTSTNGVIDSATFAPRVNFTTGAGPVSLAVGDLDGDGYLDLVVANSLANTLSIFRNTATPGQFDANTFASRVDISSGSPVGALRQVAIADLDGDGRPDLACINQNINALSIRRNVHAPQGALDGTAFAAVVNFSTATTPNGLALNDIDRDGLPELLSVSSGTVSVRRNFLKQNPVITWATPAPIDYGTPLSSTQLNAASSLAGAFIYSPAAGTIINGGDQTLTAIFFPSDSGAYNVVTNTVTLTVNKGTPIVSWSNPADITYGTALSNAQLNATATFNSLPVTGTFDYSPPAGTIIDAGAGQILSVTFTPTDTNNLSVVGPTTVSINVNKATPVITWSDPADIVYGTPLGVTQLNATVKNMGQAVAGSFAYSPDTNTVLAVGTYQALTLTFTPANSGNFDAPAMATVHINVTKAPLGIRANDITRLHGANNPTLTATYYGLVNGDVGASLTTDVTLQTTADSSSPIGDYVITASGATSPNYTITFTNGTLHVTGDDPPVIAFDAEGQNYYENSPPVILDPAVTVTDAGSPDFDGGVFTISLTSGARSTDQLSIVPGGLDADEVTLSGTNVLVGGVAIGWYEGGTNGSTPLVVHLNTNAVPANTQALARRLAFVNISEDPGSDTRIVQLVLSDGDGGTNSPATLPIYVFPENDLPTITLLTPTNGASFIAPGPVTFTVSAADVDGTVVKVKYYDGDNFLGCSTTGPDFAFTWNSATLGSGGSIYAVACDNEGGETETDTISLTFLPGITSPGFNQEGGHFQMTFVGVDGTFYDVLWSADLIHWNYLDTVLGTGSAIIFVDETSTGTEPARFYQFVPHIAIKPEGP